MHYLSQWKLMIHIGDFSNKKKKNQKGEKIFRLNISIINGKIMNNKNNKLKKRKELIEAKKQISE